MEVSSGSELRQKKGDPRIGIGMRASYVETFNVQDSGMVGYQRAGSVTLYHVFPSFQRVHHPLAKYQNGS